jgi:hypothetical protein
MHFLVPGLLAWLLFRPHWRQAWLLLVLTMAVDLDHLLSTPIFDPLRCSIGHHPLHTLPAIAAYGLLLLVPNRIVRILAVGLLFHMLTDFIDCLWMLQDCPGCCDKPENQWLCELLARL